MMVISEATWACFRLEPFSLLVFLLQTLDNRSTAVAVRGLKAGTENDVIVHMEHFGELVDMEFAAPTQDKTITAYFIYKKRRDAEQVIIGDFFEYCVIWFS